MQLNAQSAIQILAYHGGLRVAAAGFTPQDLAQMAAAAKDKNVPLTIVLTGSGLPSQNLIQIASFGGGMVTFDLVG